jgi:hypothetical protein
MNVVSIEKNEKERKHNALWKTKHMADINTYHRYFAMAVSR